jgi:hypothetical protein
VYCVHVDLGSDGHTCDWTSYGLQVKPLNLSVGAYVLCWG